MLQVKPDGTCSDGHITTLSAANAWRQRGGLEWELAGAGLVHAQPQLRLCLVRKNFQDFSSHRIFDRMHEALNIDENKN